MHLLQSTLFLSFAAATAMVERRRESDESALTSSRAEYRIQNAETH